MITTLLKILPPIFFPFLILVSASIYPKFEYRMIDSAAYPEWIDMVREQGREGWELVEVEAGVFIFTRPTSYSSKWEYLADGPDNSPYTGNVSEFLSDYGIKGWELTAIHEGAYIFKRVQLVPPPPGH